MKNIVLYAKEAKKAYEKYASIHGIDAVSNRIYDLIQTIELLNEEDKKYLDKFIDENTVNKLHLADVTFINSAGKKGTLKTLYRIYPFKYSKTDGKVFEARENSFSFIKQQNNRKSIKVYQKVYPKTAW